MIAQFLIWPPVWAIELATSHGHNHDKASTYFPAKPQSPRHAHAKVEGGVLFDQEHHRCSHLSALHDPGPHGLCRLAHNAHLKTSLRTKQRQKKTKTIKKDKYKDKGKDKKDKDKEGNKSSTHPWTGGLAKSCKRAPGDGLLSPAGKSSEGCRFFSKSVEWVWGLNARFWLVHYGTLSFSAIWTSRQIISATIQY